MESSPFRQLAEGLFLLFILFISAIAFATTAGMIVGSPLCERILGELLVSLVKQHLHALASRANFHFLVNVVQANAPMKYFR